MLADRAGTADVEVHCANFRLSTVQYSFQIGAKKDSDGFGTSICKQVWGKPLGLMVQSKPP